MSSSTAPNNPAKTLCCCAARVGEATRIEARDASRLAGMVRRIAAHILVAGLLLMGLSITPAASADPAVDASMSCDDPSCVPGIMPGAVLGGGCAQTTYYVFGVTNWGRLVFCGSPRRKAPRWFRTTELRGIKLEGNSCSARDGEMAQAPDGLFLTCDAAGGASMWTRGDV